MEPEQRKTLLVLGKKATLETWNLNNGRPIHQVGLQKIVVL